MLNKIYFTAFFVLTMTSLEAQQVYLTRKGVVNFVSNAPLEVIKASSDALQGAIDVEKKTLAFSMDNKSFKGFNSSLQQEHFYENYMETGKYPYSTFKGKIIEDIDTTSIEEQEVRAKGILYIHGIEQERIIKGTVQLGSGKITVHAEFTVPLEDHDIKIPRIVYQKIAEVINVSISAEMNKKTD